MPVERLCQISTPSGDAYVELNYNANNGNVQSITVHAPETVHLTMRKFHDEPPIVDTDFVGDRTVNLPGGHGLKRLFGTSYKTFTFDRSMRLGPVITMSWHS